MESPPPPSKITILPPTKQEKTPQTTAPNTQNQPFWQLNDIDTSDVCKNKKYISFTFDDAPAKSLETIAAIFADYNEQNPDCKATATFFINGVYAQSQTHSLLRSATALGMELGNHTFSHFDLTTLSKGEIQTSRAFSKTIASLD